MTTVLLTRAAAVRQARGHDHALPRRDPVSRGLPLADAAAAFLTGVLLRPWGEAVAAAPVAVAAAGAALAAVWIGALRAAGAYDRGVLADHRSTRAIRVAPALPLAVLLLAALRGATIDAPRLAALTVVVASASYLQHTLVGLARTRTRAPARVVLAGHPHGVRWLLDDLETSGRLSVVAVCVTDAVSRGDFAAPVVTGWENLRSCVREHAAEAVVVVPCRHVDPGRIRRAGWDLEAARDGTGLFIASGLPEAGVAGARVTTAGRVPLVPVRWARTSGAARWAKSVGERVVAAVALVAVAPLLVALAALIRLESPGPAVFRQTRIGKGGVPFTMLKLRTMCADAAQLQASLSATTPAELMLFKLRADPRITRLGRFLRTYSLDELPQLVNVVRGQMALVGPRPALPCEVERYERDVFRRLTVTPGMTGLWQVSGRSDLSWEESVRLDLRYVDDWTPGLDLRILLRTVGAVLGHRGAY